LGSVGLHPSSQLVEHLNRRARGIGLRLEHQRRHSADEHRLGHALGSVTPDVTSHLAAAGRVSDMDRILEVELCYQFREIVGIGVHVVAVPWLA